MNITINTDNHWQKAQEIIKNIAMGLEKYGDVKILSAEVEVKEPMGFILSKTEKGGATI